MRTIKFQALLLVLTPDGPARIYFPSSLWRGRVSNPRQIHQQSCSDPGPFEGRSTDWANAPQPMGSKLVTIGKGLDYVPTY